MSNAFPPSPRGIATATITPTDPQLLAKGALSVVFEATDSEVVHLGYLVKAGTRHEDTPDAGMAHFIEHMSFKGTEKRRAIHISNGLERVGGDLNAYTNKQETVYYATILRKDVRRAVDVLSDIVFRSTYPEREIRKEVEVICDEIESYRDTPAELIFDEFEALAFAKHPLGRDILGTPDRLRTYTTADALRFARRHYRPGNAVFFATGNVAFSTLLRMLSKEVFGGAATIETRTSAEKKISAAEKTTFAAEVFPTSEVFPPTYGESERIVEKPIHQAHVVCGATTVGGRSADRHALLLLNNLLGGPGMNSRLNQRLREKAGLVYSVDSYLTFYPDCGIWYVYFGCDAEDVGRCRRLLERELEKLATETLSPTALAAAKQQLCGQIGIAAENRESSAIAMAKSYAWYGTIRRQGDICAAIEAVTAEELRRVAATLFRPDRRRTLIYRPTTADNG